MQVGRAAAEDGLQQVVQGDVLVLERRLRSTRAGRRTRRPRARPRGPSARGPVRRRRATRSRPPAAVPAARQRPGSGRSGGRPQRAAWRTARAAARLGRPAASATGSARYSGAGAGAGAWAGGASRYSGCGGAAASSDGGGGRAPARSRRSSSTLPRRPSAPLRARGQDRARTCSALPAAPAGIRTSPPADPFRRTVRSHGTRADLAVEPVLSCVASVEQSACLSVGPDLAKPLDDDPQDFVQRGDPVEHLGEAVVSAG